MTVVEAGRGREPQGLSQWVRGTRTLTKAWTPDSNVKHARLSWPVHNCLSSRYVFVFPWFLPWHLLYYLLSAPFLWRLMRRFILKTTMVHPLGIKSAWALIAAWSGLCLKQWPFTASRYTVSALSSHYCLPFFLFYPRIHYDVMVSCMKARLHREQHHFR